MDDEDDVELMLDVCEEQDNRLSNRERQFLDECQYRLGEGGTLALWRLEILKVLYNRVRSSG